MRNTPKLLKRGGGNVLVVLFCYFCAVVFISFTVALEVAEWGMHDSPGSLISPGAKETHLPETSTVRGLAFHTLLLTTCHHESHTSQRCHTSKPEKQKMYISVAHMNRTVPLTEQSKSRILRTYLIYYSQICISPFTHCCASHLDRNELKFYLGSKLFNNMFIPDPSPKLLY